MHVALVVAAAALAAAATAGAATPRPDAHDRALVSQLGGKVATFQAVATQTNGGNELKTALAKCPLLKKDPAQAFAAVFALLPALLIDVVNQYRPQLTDVRDTLARMHPNSPLFRQWLAAEVQVLGLTLEFDNHGKKIDLCRAATVMLDKKSSAQDVKNALGVAPAVIAKLFQGGSSAASATLKRLNPQMRAFFVAAGLSPKVAAALTK